MGRHVEVVQEEHRGTGVPTRLCFTNGGCGVPAHSRHTPLQGGRVCTRVPPNENGHYQAPSAFGAGGGVLKSTTHPKLYPPWEGRKCPTPMLAHSIPQGVWLKRSLSRPSPSDQLHAYTSLNIKIARDKSSTEGVQLTRTRQKTIPKFLIEYQWKYEVSIAKRGPSQNVLVVFWGKWLEVECLLHGKWCTDLAAALQVALTPTKPHATPVIHQEGGKEISEWPGQRGVEE